MFSYGVLVLFPSTEGPTLRHEIEIRESDQFSASLTEEIERDTQCVKDVHTHPTGVTHL